MKLSPATIATLKIAGVTVGSAALAVIADNGLPHTSQQWAVLLLAVVGALKVLFIHSPTAPQAAAPASPEPKA